MRASEAYFDLPCILMSSLPEASVRERLDGYAAFVREPFYRGHDRAGCRDSRRFRAEGVRRILPRARSQHARDDGRMSVSAGRDALAAGAGQEH